MRRSRNVLSLVVAVLALTSAGTSTVQAQLPFSNVPNNRPAVSPFLNLLNNNNRSGVSNYFTLVQPQIAARNDLLRQQSQISQLQQRVNQPRNAGIPVSGSREIRGTGHETVFLNYLNFYTVPRR